jgi:hypothetical protein
MFSNYDDDGDCSASPGVMGHRACHRWPGCGCGGTDETYKGPTEKVWMTIGGLTALVDIPARGTPTLRDEILDLERGIELLEEEIRLLKERVRDEKRILADLKSRL